MKFENDTDYKKIKLTSLNFHHKLKPFVLAISVSASLFAGNKLVSASDDIYFVVLLVIVKIMKMII